MKSEKRRGLSRRDVLRCGAAAAGGLVAAPVIITSSALGAPGHAPASDRIVMGTIGYGGRASYVMGALMTQPDVQMVAVCDVKQNRRKAGKAAIDKKYGNTDSKAYIDLLELLARSDIDAVLIATGDNWHSLAACLAARAGKDIYCEKPMSVTIAEGRQLAETIRRYATVFQCGTQRRSLDHFKFATNLVQRGLLGEIRDVYAEKAPWWIETYQTRLPAEPEPPREVFDWDRWLGPAAWRPYNKKYPTRSFWGGDLDFAGGSYTEWGSHTVDLCQWATGMDHTSPVEYEPVGSDVVATYANGMKLHITQPIGKGSCGVRYEGTEGWVQVDDSGHIEVYPESLRATWRLGKGYPVDNHVRNFLDCVKTRQQPVSTADAAHHSITACHVANICRRLGRPVKWNPQKELFIDDEEANRFVLRAYRQPWRL